MTEGQRLQDDIAGGGGFGGAGENGNSGGVGGELIEEIVIAAAADDVETIDFLIRELLDLAQCSAVKERERFERAADECPFGFRRGLAGAAAELDDLRNHVFWREEFVGGRI